MVTGLEIHRRETVLGGRAFGATGAYEKIIGTLRFEVDPTHRLHGAIADIGLAPVNARGRVAFSGDFYLLKPADMRKGNRRLLLDVPNRGRKVSLGMFNSAQRVPDPQSIEDFGNGFLLRHGYTLAWVGWQADVPRQDGLMALDPPRAQGASGWIRCELRPHTRVACLPLADRYHIPNPVLDLDDPQARVTVCEHMGAPEVELPRSAWRFPDAGHLALADGFMPGAIYTILYRSAEPPIVGLGLPAVRDTAAWLRWGSAESGNPCVGAIERAYAFGFSQSARFLRHMLFLALDEDEDGRVVFDGVMPHAGGARRGEFNLRLGQPSRNVHVSVGSLPPFDDHALYARLRERGRMPRIIATNTSPEYWRGDASLVHTDADGMCDVDPAPFARTYLFAGTQHPPGVLPPLAADPNTGDRGEHMFNVVDYAPLLRAALTNLDHWVTDEVPPPESAFPRLAQGTAVPHESLGAFFRGLPGVRFPDRITRPARLDFGPEIERGIPCYPARSGEDYRTYASTIDADGNEVAGVRAPEVAAPLATFTGWNTRHPEQGAPGDLMAMMGSTLPFAPTLEMRERRGDARPSIAERYPSRAAYLERVREAARALIAARHVLPEDLEAIVARAGRLWDFVNELGAARST
jgi:hypothetical protein